MAIRARINRPRKLEYHRLYGSVEKPPLENGELPNGAIVSSLNHPVYRNLSLVIGASTRIHMLHDKISVWVCKTPCIVKNWHNMGCKLPKGVSFFDPDQHLAFVEQYVPETSTGRIMERIVDEYEELHGIYLIGNKARNSR